MDCYRAGKPEKYINRHQASMEILDWDEQKALKMDFVGFTCIEGDTSYL